MTKEKMRIKRLDPAFREKERAQGRASKKFLWANSEEFREKVRNSKRTRYCNNPDYRNAVLRRNRKWNTSEKDRNSARLREHRRRELEGKATLSLADWTFILDLQDHRCAKCFKRFTEVGRPERDHIISVADGGTLTLNNVQALCRSCNSSKHSKSIDYRMETQRAFVAWVCDEAKMASYDICSAKRLSVG